MDKTKPETPDGSEEPADVTQRHSVVPFKPEESTKLDLEGTSSATASKPAQLTPFTQVPAGWPARFAPLGVLGSGGTSVVLAATDEALQREVAIKLLQGEHQGDPETRARFLEEARLTASLEHPNIAPIYDVQASGKNAYLVMRQVQGDSLGRRIRRAREAEKTEAFPINDLINIFLKVCNALAFAHDKGFVHHDVKPDNIIVGDFGEVVLVDWGAASGAVSHQGQQSHVTGTPQYMSPELMLGEGATPQSDIYALGVTMFYAFLLRRPLEGFRGPELWEKRIAGALEPPNDEERARLPRQLLDIVMRAMSNDLTERYPSVAALAADLANFQAGRSAWSSPMLVETFESDWGARWISPEPTAFDVVDGRAISRHERIGLLALRQRISAGVAVEFEGTVLPGFRAGDLAVLWTESSLEELLSPTKREGKERAYSLKVGGLSNLYAGIYEGFGAYVVSRSFELETGRAYLIRAEIEERILRLIVDGKLLAQHEVVFPFTSGQLALYGFFPGKEFKNVKIYTRGIPDRVSPIIAGDVFYRRGLFQDAARQYVEIAEAHRGERLGDEAIYKQGLCLYQLEQRAAAFALWRTITDSYYSGFWQLHELDNLIEARSWSVFFIRFRELYAAYPTLGAALRSRWATYAQKLWLVEVQLGALVDLRTELFADDATTEPTAGLALERACRFQEIIERCPAQRPQVAAALLALGRPEEVIANFGEVPFLVDAAHIEMGMLDEVGPERDLYAFTVLLKGELEEAARLSPDNPEMLLALGDDENPAVANFDIRHVRATALRRRGLLAEAMASGDVISLLFGNRLQEALQHAERFVELRIVWAAKALDSYIRGDLEEYRAALTRLGELPRSYRFQNTWFAEFIMLPFLSGLSGDQGALVESCQKAIAQERYRYSQRLYYFARYVLGEIDDEAFLKQPVRLNARSRLLVASALRAERSSNIGQALENYRAYAALSARERAFEHENDDPILYRFVLWRIEQLERG